MDEEFFDNRFSALVAATLIFIPGSFLFVTVAG
jgi:hypothetical protein